MTANRFLIAIAVLIVVVTAGAFGWRIFAARAIISSLKPAVAYVEPPRAGDPDYAKASAWLARPDLAGDATRWTPPGVAATGKPQAQAFFIAPTADLSRDRWNTPLDDPEVRPRLDQFLRGEASALNGVAAIWAPKYRAATIGAFLVQDGAEAPRAFDLAYRDVTRAWDVFLRSIPPGAPIILAAHSQGSMHLIRLLREHIAGTPVQTRLVVVYAAGWPVSLSADLPALGLPTCGPGTAGCLASWQTWAADGDPDSLMRLYARTRGLTGQPRENTPMLCVNPLSGQAGTEPVAAAGNAGTLVPDATMTGAVLQPGLVGAACDARGLLRLIGTPPAVLDPFVLPGGNYHVYDYPLFWANLRADAAARVATYLARGKHKGEAEPEG